MQTYDDIFSIENRAMPRSRMLYITPPYTPLVEDVGLVGAEMSMATQEHLSNKIDWAAQVARIHVRHLGRSSIPELASGAIITHNL